MAAVIVLGGGTYLYSKPANKPENLKFRTAAIAYDNLTQVRAQLGAAEATLVLARATYERNQKLVTAGFISALALDQGKREVDASTANVEVARAQVQSAETDLGNSVIRSCRFPFKLSLLIFQLAPLTLSWCD